MATDGDGQGWGRDVGGTEGWHMGYVRGVDAGEMWAMAMCSLRGLGCMWHVHKGCEQGQQSIMLLLPLGLWFVVQRQRW